MRRPSLIACSTAVLAVVAAAPASAAPARTHAPVASAARTAPDRIFGGASTNRNAFVLRLAGRRLHSALVWVDARCDDGASAVFGGPIDFEAQQPTGVPVGTSVLVGRRLSRRGRFSSRGRAAIDYGAAVGFITQRMTGRVRGAQADGTLELTIRLVDKATRQPVTTCRSGRLTWRAVSSPRRVFGGLTNDQRPVVVELRPDRRVVRAVLVGWSASCTPEDSFSMSDAVSNFSISPTGRFGAPFSGRFPIEGGAGGEREVAYTLAGRLRGRGASGAFSVTMTDRDPAGATTSTCRTGTVRFTARSTRR